MGDLFLVATHAFDRPTRATSGSMRRWSLRRTTWSAPTACGASRSVNPDFRGTIYDYRRSGRAQPRRTRSPADYPLFRSVTPMWDNEARRPGARHGVRALVAGPAIGEWLQNACRYTLDQAADSDKPFVFVNAWNEWAEGAHLEPDRATATPTCRRPPTRCEVSGVGTRPPIVVVSHDALFHGAQRLALILARTLATRLGLRRRVLICAATGRSGSGFGRSGRVHDFFSPATTPEAQERVIHELLHTRARASRSAIPACVGDLVELLKPAGFRVVSMIHELPGLIGEYGLESSIAAIARSRRPGGVSGRRRARPLHRAHGPGPGEGRGAAAGSARRQSLWGTASDARRELLRNTLGLDEATKIVLAVGYADLRKGIDLFVEVGLIADAGARRCRVRVGRPQRGDGLRPAAQRAHGAGCDGPVLLPGADRGHRSVLRRRRCLPDDVARRSVSQRGPCMPSTPSSRSLASRVRAVRRAARAAVAASWCRFSTRQAMAAATCARARRSRRGATAGGHRKAILDPRVRVRRLRALPRARSPQEPPDGLGHRAELQLRAPSARAAAVDSGADLSRRTRSSSSTTARSTTASTSRETLLQGSAIPYRIIRNETNQGVYRQWLRGIREATGDLSGSPKPTTTARRHLLETLVPAFARARWCSPIASRGRSTRQGDEIAPDYLPWTADINATKWRRRLRAPRRRRDSRHAGREEHHSERQRRADAEAGPRPRSRSAAARCATPATGWSTSTCSNAATSRSFPQALNCHRRHGGSVTIGHGGLNLMREILLVQRHMLERHAIASDVRAEAGARTLQATYEYLGLNADGPPLQGSRSAEQSGRRCGLTVRDDLDARHLAPDACLVLGGAGFLGGHIVEALLERGPGGSCLRSVPRRARSAVAGPDVEWCEGDFGNRGDVAAALDGCDVVFHLVATTLPKGSNDDPVHDLESNLLPTVRFLDAAVAHGVKKVVFASRAGRSTASRGACRCPRIIQRNRFAPTASTSSRSSSTCTCTTRCTACEYCVLRLANPFGERQRSDASQGAVAVFLDKALRGEDVTVWGDGSAVRDYVYVRDVAPAFCQAAALPAETGVFNIGSGQGLSVNALLDAIEDLLARPVPRRYVQGRAFDVPVNVLDIRLATETLGWRPRFTFRQGLERTLEWIQKTATAPG